LSSRLIGMHLFSISLGSSPANAMSKPQYGAEHKKARALAIANLIDGTPCRYCGRPMYKRQSLDLDHIVPVALGNGSGPTVLTHSKCNRAAGGRLAARKKMARRKAAVVKRNARLIGGSVNPATRNHPVRRRLPKW